MGKWTARSRSINPITLARESVEMTPSDLVIASAGSPSNVWNLERGLLARPTQKVIDALAAAGANVDGLEEAYTKWRAEQAVATIKRCSLAAAAGARG